MTAHLPADSSLAAKTPFNVAVAYDEVAMGVRAKHVLDSITRTLEPDCRLVVNIWRFSMLQMPVLADSAVLEAVAANLIILALREDNGVPPEARAWIETWLLGRAGTAGALVLLLEPENHPGIAARPAHGYLLDVGQRGNLDVFALSDSADWDDLKWLCPECNQFQVSSPPRCPLFGPPADWLGKPAQDRARFTSATPLQA